MLNIAKKVFGSKNDRELKKLAPLVQQVASFEADMKKLNDEQLKGKTVEFRERLAKGEALDDLLPEAFAAVREAAWRVLGMRHFDCQILGGIVLHQGSIAEMKTGEGKTLTATLPVYLNALPAKGVFVVTVNDYLAQRDSEWMGQLYNWMGLSVGNIVHGVDDRQRRDAYACDITYGTNNEFGFDYLRDNMKFSEDQMVQRGFFYAIVDEVDSVLIDEARTPLIISGPAEESTHKYYEANATMLKLEKDVHYTVDEKDNHALFTEDGIARAEKLLGLENLYDAGNIEILHCLEQSLKAHFLFRKDVDYLVEDGQVIIIDQHTGRKMPGRRYSDGLHQGLEAKEGVNIEKQNQTLASVTFQNFFRMFEKLSGMTGTAETEAPEFLSIYKLECYVIPTNRPIARRDEHDTVYGTKAAKFRAIVKEIKEHSVTGRPILVGTIAIETSEELSSALTKAGIKHTVLNAKYHEREADIVAQAGRLGGVTIATNMAGRGTDIILGGNAENLAHAECRTKEDANFEEVLEKYKKICEEEKKKVLELGGLYILGTERHESRRIDNQLRGRAGRQGDPGLSRFFLSLEDKLMRLFGSPKIKDLLAKNMSDDEPIQHKMVNRAIEKAQKAVEARNFDSRKHILEYDDVMNKQRNTFYGMRYELLKELPREFFFKRAEAIASAVVEEFQALERSSDDDLQRFRDMLRTQFAFTTDESFDPNNFDREAMIEQIKEQYCEKWDTLGIPEDAVTNHERFIMLYVIDQQWKEHMRNMDFLKEGISLHSYAQKDPLIEYKKGSYEMFNALMDRIDEEVVKTLINVTPRVNDESVNRMRAQRTREERAMKLAGKEEDERPKTVRRAQPKIGRNEPCYCGSGKKYKQCHGKR